jgi:alkylation response protein AidB-like acyl-CoA dehydrogenase
MATGAAAGSTIAIGDERVALAAGLRRFVAERCPPLVVRRAVDDGERGKPDFWEAMAELGWLGLHLRESTGGQGYGLAEAVVVAEEFGRAPAPGPLLSTLVAGAVLRVAAVRGSAVGAAGEATPNRTARDWLARVASGRATLAVASTAPAVVASADGAAVQVTGSWGVVPGADVADAFIVPFIVPDDGIVAGRAKGTGDDPGDGSGPVSGSVEQWCLLDADQVTTRVVDPLDLTRSIAEVSVEGLTLDPQRRLTGVDRALVGAALATFAAAECAGVAAWCVETAAAYAAERRQFGRPIGQFQAVKHRCADMLVATEATRAVAWDAAAAADAFLAALDDGGNAEAIEEARTEWVLAAASAAAVALDAAVRVAEDCIQVLGGIGFTWEHDAHLHLRRAVALRQQLGGTARWRRQLADLALGGARRRLRVEVPPEGEPRRAQIRAHAEELAGLEGSARRARLVELGYLVPHWPQPWGIDADATTQLLIDAELRRAKVRRPHLQVGAWAAPTIAAHGTPEQQERWVRPTLLGETTWCQLFSEPEAGSDLAGLRTRATRVEGGWSVTGQKVWTTMAAEARWGICLVRTDPDAPKHAGITYLIMDMRSPGIDIRPLREMTGLEMFNEVFFDDMFVPDDCVIGEVNGGWALARTTLGNERVAMGSGSSFGGGVENLLTLVRKRAESDLGHAPAPSELWEEAGDHRGFPPRVRSGGAASGGAGSAGESPGDGRDEPSRDRRGGWPIDPVVLDRLGGLVAEAHAVATLGARSTLRSVAGARPGPEASVRKLLGVEHDQRVQEFGLELLGPAGAAVEGDAATWTFGFLANRCLTIAGGTSEIQRNVIGERLLGLPRDPEPGESHP